MKSPKCRTLVSIVNHEKCWQNLCMLNMWFWFYVLHLLTDTDCSKEQNKGKTAFSHEKFVSGEGHRALQRCGLPRNILIVTHPLFTVKSDIFFFCCSLVHGFRLLASMSGSPVLVTAWPWQICLPIFQEINEFLNVFMCI